MIDGRRRIARPVSRGRFALVEEVPRWNSPPFVSSVARGLALAKIRSPHELSIIYPLTNLSLSLSLSAFMML
jgi:hypothetical protein